jgi:hypothetical protein
VQLWTVETWTDEHIYTGCTDHTYDIQALLVEPYASCLEQALALSPLSPAILAGYNGAGVLNGTGIAILSLGVAMQLYVAGVNYARTAPEGYNAVNDAKV